MKSLILIVVSYACCLYLVESAKPFTAENCHGTRGIASVHRFDVSPDPISFSQNISASVHLELHEDLPSGTFIKNKIYKVTSLFGVPIYVPAPCVGNTGSCTTEACEYLKGVKSQACPFFPQDVKCGCPLQAGNFKGENIVIPLPEMGSFIKWLASGDFEMEMKLVKKEGSMEKQIGCFKFTGSAVP